MAWVCGVEDQEHNRASGGIADVSRVSGFCAMGHSDRGGSQSSRCFEKREHGRTDRRHHFGGSLVVRSVSVLELLR